MTDSDPDPQHKPHDAAPPNATPVYVPADTADNALILRVSDKRLLVMLSILVIGVLGMQIVRSAGWGLEAVEIQRTGVDSVDYRIDINRGTWFEWAQIPDIGETTARRIVADRNINGPFASVDDVGRVPGIGPRTLVKIRPWLMHGDSNVAANEADVAGLDSSN